MEALNTATLHGLADARALNHMDPLSTEFIYSVLHNLPVIEFAKSREVCKKWNKIASDPVLWKTLNLRVLFPRLKIIGAEQLRSTLPLGHAGFVVEDDRTVNVLESLPVLHRFFTKFPETGATLLTMPKGVSQKKLEKLSSLKTGEPPGLSDDSDDEYNALEEVPDDNYPPKHNETKCSINEPNYEINETYRLLITDFVTSDEVFTLGFRRLWTFELQMLAVVTLFEKDIHLSEEAPCDYIYAAYPGNEKIRCTLKNESSANAVYGAMGVFKLPLLGNN